MGPEPGPAGSRPSTRCPRDGRWAELFTQVLISCSPWAGQAPLRPHCQRQIWKRPATL